MKNQSLKKSTQPYSLAGAGDLTSMLGSKPGNQTGFNQAHLLGSKDQPACSLQLEHDKGFYQGHNVHDYKRFYSRNPLACFPGLRKHRHVCQFSGTGGMTTDSRTVTVSQRLSLNVHRCWGKGGDGLHGQEVCYI